MGTAILLLGANLLAAAVALVTFVLYVFVYTPLKPLTTLNTVVGAIPGALPPLIGWAAATGRLGVEAWALFLIVFLWQFPHFLAIAWIYREDYQRAGFRMLTGRRCPGPDDGLPGRLVCAGAGPGGALAGDGRPGRAGLFRRGPAPGPRLPGRGRSVLAGGQRPSRLAACSVRRLSTCPRS